jgi:fermentation-respiration switch protein FrsA (DUF1100 family)
MVVQVAEKETLLRNRPAVRASRQAARGELRRYPGLDHFDVYWDSGFETVIEDQIEFLKRHHFIG